MNPQVRGALTLKKTGGRAAVIYVVGSVVAIMAITFAVAWLVTARWPHRTVRWQVTLAALAVPLLAFASFVAAVLATLIDAPNVPERGTVGMVIFSMVFFLVYAVVAGLAIGIPTAMVAVRMLRR